MQIKSAKDLIVDQKAYALAMEIFEVSKAFPPRKGTHLPIKSGDPHGLFVQIYEKHGQSVGTRHIL
jgi:hypothetical protein